MEIAIIYPISSSSKLTRVAHRQSWIYGLLHLRRMTNWDKDISGCRGNGEKFPSMLMCERTGRSQDSLMASLQGFMPPGRLHDSRI